MPLEVRPSQDSSGRFCLYKIGSDEITFYEFGLLCFNSELQANQVATALNGEMAYQLMITPPNMDPTISEKSIKKLCDEFRSKIKGKSGDDLQNTD